MEAQPARESITAETAAIETGTKRDLLINPPINHCLHKIVRKPFIGDSLKESYL
jgi:hypothetical protein